MRELTTVELSEKLAGGDSFIRTKNNIVKGLAITTRKNPEAPDVIVVGKGPRIIANTELFIQQNQHVPVYIKVATNAWRFIGNYKAESYSRDAKAIEKHRRHRLAENIDGILFLSAEDDIKNPISSNYNLSPEKKRKIELAAIELVKTHYKEMGYTIIDLQAENRGYDLIAENGNDVLKLEVKGTSTAERRLFISRNERRVSPDPLWRLVLVRMALSKSPTLEIFTASQMEEKFNFESLSWECTEVLEHIPPEDETV